MDVDRSANLSDLNVDRFARGRGGILFGQQYEDENRDGNENGSPENDEEEEGGKKKMEDHHHHGENVNMDV